MRMERSGLELVSGHGGPRRVRMKGTTIDGVTEVGTSQTTFSDPAQSAKDAPSTSYDKVLARLRALSQQTYSRLPWNSDIPPSKDGRHIDLDVQRHTLLIDDRTRMPYVDNTVRSSRYTFWSFFPRQLFAQFSKLANFYFLCVSIVQMIPTVSTTGRYTTIVPLLFFVGISMLKEGLDDLRRSRLDKEENNRTASVYQGSRVITPAEERLSETSELWAESRWRDLRVGDVLRIQRDEAVPADIVLLNVDGARGVAYIETMALDGETSLKWRRAPPPLARSCGQGNILCSIKAYFVVEDPNPDLHSFEGKVSIANKVLPLTNNEIIYRGSILRNTLQVIGMVIYTGEECKIRMNATKNPRTKAPNLQGVVNKVVMMMVCFVVALSIFSTVAYQIWKVRVENHAFYLSHAGVATAQLLASFFLMFNAMIPLSLYISLEIVKLAQMGAMREDIDMYDEDSDTPMEPRTSTINEDLGQVSYVFSDKTGTLTDNTMQFRAISIAGTAWLHDPDLREVSSSGAQEEKLIHTKGDKGVRAIPRTSTVAHDGKNTMISTLEDCRPAVQQNGFDQWKREQRHNDYHVNKTEEMLDYMQRKPHTVFARRVRFFLLSIALCHTCLPEKGEDGKMIFQAASPDELALVKAAQDLGYLVVDRQSHSITIRTYPGGADSDPIYETYEILDVLEFSSARSRMSIVIRMPDQRICVFCKGADMVIQHRLRLSRFATEKTEIAHMANQQKNIKAQQATRHASTAAASIRYLKASMIGRRSRTDGRLSPMRDGIDDWLRDRKNEGRAFPTEHTGTWCSPRASAHLLAGRQSPSRSEGMPSSGNEQFDRLVEEGVAVDDSADLERCLQHITDFAREGLRTLLYAYKYIDDADYALWRKSYQEATTSLANRQALIEQAGDQLERDLELIGATAIEDKLQKGVPEAIDKLRRANIKLWMLTGDKRETAIKISRSCHLLKDYSTIMILDHKVDDLDQTMAAIIDDINVGAIAHCVIVIDGQTLSTVEAQPDLRDLFMNLVMLADSVVCYRASPSQKASIVRSVRIELLHGVTLAIGDGANDIAMIQEAHVGIGITGKEGLQAARASDYSIAQFRFLPKLLLVHGHWNYIRTCLYVLGTFYKEMLLNLTQALYQRWNGYTGISLYESWSLTMFQILFTCLPVIFTGIYEKDLAASTLLAIPELYTKGQRNGGFNNKIFLWWTFVAASDAVLIFFVMFKVYGNAALTKDNGIYAMGTLTFTACVIIISVKMQVLEMHNKTTTAVSAILFSIGSWFVWILALSAAYTDNDIYRVKGGLLERFGQDALWWLTLIVMLLAVFVWELAVASIRRWIWPTDVDIFQEYEKDPEMRRRFQEAAADGIPTSSVGRGTKKGNLEFVAKTGAGAAKRITT